MHLLILAVSAVSSVNITCKYYFYDWNNWGERYTCSATLGDVIQPAVPIINVSGEHRRPNTDNDVRGVEIHNQKTYFILRGLTRYFPNMSDLYVFRSDLRRVTRSDLTEYKDLVTLVLSRNRLTFIPIDAFDDMTRLEYLSLSFNALFTIPNLRALKNLKELYLFENSIETISASDFENNENLEVIWLYFNKIQYIDPAGVFEYATKLKYADLTNNRCVDVKYVRGRDDFRFNEVIRNNCQPKLAEDRLYDFTLYNHSRPF